MKKTLLFLCCVMAFLTSCSNDDYSQESDSANKQKSSDVRWYGVKTLDASNTRGVADEGKLWNQRVGIYVKFINSPSDATMVDKVKAIATEWEEYAGIKFHFVEGDANADVRIAFDWNGNEWLTWSYTGTDAKKITDKTQPTAVFGGLEYLDDESFRGDILRVFGQILGLEYEQRHQEWSGFRTEDKLQAYWESMFEGIDFDWATIREYVFTPLTDANAVHVNQTPEVDALSIMAWPYYGRQHVTQQFANTELSEGDKTFIGQLYPKENQSLPTIQEAWIDTGFFEWATKENWANSGFAVVSDAVWIEGTVAVKLTELGAQQEYLPDVRDGEQLTSAQRMFYHSNYLAIGSLLKKNPKFNTSNITDFSQMFCLNRYLTEIVPFDTSKGINFSGMFSGVYNVEKIPKFDTSNGTNFSAMFQSCNSVKEFPLIDTSKGTDFSSMFSGCDLIVNIPFIDTSNGTNFEGMFNGCTSIVDIPLLNTSKGTNFRNMFAACASIVNIPLIDTSNGTNFSSMFFKCSNVTDFPLIDTSKGTNFVGMFSECASMTTIPLIDTSNGTSFVGMFSFSHSLTTIPLLNTSKGTNFKGMFVYCTGLKSLPLLDTSNATIVEGMLHNCTSLEQVPAFNLSKATDREKIITSFPYPLI